MSVPTDIKVGTQALFDRLQQGTRPFFFLNRTGQGCEDRDGLGALAGAASDSGTSAARGARAGAEGVAVLSREDVGPYDTVVLSSTSTPELLTWLNDNGYDQPPESAELFDHYVKQGMTFVALKLRQEANVGDIQPLVLEMDHAEACVPLVLTRVAALEDMPVLIYTLAAAQTAPKNWFRVEVNAHRIDWLRGGSNYAALVTEAIDEAAGRGFVTEFAGVPDFMENALVTSGVTEPNWPVSNPGAPPEPPSDPAPGEIRSAPVDLTDVQSWRDALAQAGIFGDGVAENIFETRAPGGFVEDPDGLAMELQARVVQPRVDAQAMFSDFPYLTRMVTTVSPDEMTRDPMFHINGDLEDVDNLREATLERSCSLTGVTEQTLIFADGTRMPVDPNAFGGMTTPDEPASRRITLVAASGAPVEYGRAQAAMVDGLLDIQDVDTIIQSTPGRPDFPTAAGVVDENGLFGCAIGRDRRGQGASWMALSGLALIGSLAFARRCRHRRHRRRRS